MSESHRWRDARLGAALKDVRRHIAPEGRSALDRLIDRLRFIDRVLANWDQHHERQAIAHIEAGRMQAASLAAWMLFDDEARDRLLAKISIGVDPSAAAERVAAAIEAGREVL